MDPISNSLIQTESNICIGDFIQAYTHTNVDSIPSEEVKQWDYKEGYTSIHNIPSK